MAGCAQAEPAAIPASRRKSAKLLRLKCMFLPFTNERLLRLHMGMTKTQRLERETVSESITGCLARWFPLRRYILKGCAIADKGSGRKTQDPHNIMSKQTIAVHLPDGAIREVPAGTTPLEIANSISPRLAAASVVARLIPLGGAGGHGSSGNGESGSGETPSEATMYAAEDAAAPRLVDLSTPLTADSRLELVTEKDPEALKVVRHSAAHVLATAVLELFPETKLGHGPGTDSGFFYDCYREKALHA